MRYNYLYMDPWSAPLKTANTDRKPLYICLSGNSGAGKSTLLRKIAVGLFQEDRDTIAIDEKAVHHPLLPALFDNTQEYGYLIQLNFMIQRALLIKSWLDKGFNLVMERSHIEDYIFINFMQQAGYITDQQHAAYMQLWQQINALLPPPDIIVWLNFDPEHSLRNLQRDETQGIRPEEFPDNQTKNRWISGWYQQYQQFTHQLPAGLVERVIECRSPGTPDSLSATVLERIYDIRRLYASKDHRLSDY